ncbi:MAG: 5-methyltetrahydropteroyltriglutamate--homocysteine methyltransferase [Gaiellales bacterium]|nr:5-methyltetrahydropteroyltriglutamate--homocysteine methyltransferase [Gaiellales bacterium]MDX6597186.1 5-methyltetrahydropteroyltriglutamate--homocysteine methyltransferase [Gaiellales bacterium]
MPKKIVDTILPTTMVGSYPRPHWFTQQLLGRDVRVAFKEVQHEEAYHDATHAVIADQEEAGLDIVTDGQMSYDDYVGVIGSFCWYMYERIPGFDPAREVHPVEAMAETRDKTVELLADWGGVINSGEVKRGPIRLADLYKIAAKHTDKPIKVSVGAGPVNLAWHVHFQHYKDPKELSYALAPIFNAEMKDLVEAGANYLQIEDLGAWLPLFTGDDSDWDWISDVIGQCCDGVDAKIGWHFCFGNAWGNDILSANFPEGYQTALPRLFETPGIDQFVLDYANRDMAGIEFLKNLPADKEVQVGVLDIRTMMVETPETVAARARKVLEHVDADRVTLSTDCGMKPLPRTIAKMKLKALVEGAKIVRAEIS